MKKKPGRATALIIVDMMNLLDFPEGASLARRALPAAKRMATLKQRFVDRELPVIYANDNFGQWHLDLRELVELCAQGTGAKLAQLLRPDENDYYVLKPRHSAFFATPLHVLLDELQVGRVVLCGIASDMCIAASAIDAHVHGFVVIVPADCIEAETGARNRAALKQIGESFQLATTESRYLRF